VCKIDFVRANYCKNQSKQPPDSGIRQFFLKFGGKDQWAEDDFEDHKINIDENQVEMKLCEKEVKLDWVKMRNPIIKTTP